MSPTGRVTYGALAVIAAFALGVWVGRANQARMSRDDLREIVRDELARAAASAGHRAPPSDDVPPPTAVPASPAEEIAGAKALATVRSAVARGRWTDSDRDDVRALLQRVGPTHRSSVMQELFAALNSGKIKIEVSGPPI